MSVLSTMTTIDPPNPTGAGPDEGAVRRGTTPTVLVFAGGDPFDASAHRRLRSFVGERPEIVIAADSGLHLAQDGGWRPDVVIGDLDSVDAGRLATAEAAGARIDRHPAAKAATDLELALDLALASGVERIVVGGGHGGRLDHLLANVMLLGSPRYASVEIAGLLGEAWVHIVRREVGWSGDRGDLVTLLALAGPVGGVRTSGLLYPLTDATLQPGSTRGVSNEQLGTAASVAVTSGVLAVVRPGPAGTHVLGAGAAVGPSHPIEANPSP